MITIITGSVNSGKTSWLLTDAAKFNNAEGFICVKIFENEVHIGYDLVSPAQTESVAFIRRTDFLPAIWNEVENIANTYSFSREGFEFAESAVCRAVAPGNQARFYLDEAGHLEISGRGFAPMLKRLLCAKVDLVVVVRESLLAKFLEAYSVTDYELIRI